MLLEKLAEFHDRIEGNLRPRHHEKREIDWLIDLSSDGEFRGFIKTQDADGDFELAVPYLRRSGKNPPPYLLVDKPAYVLGLGLDKWTDDKVQPRYEAFCNLLQECAKETGDESLEKINRFYETSINEARRKYPEDLGQGDLVGFLVDGHLPVSSPDVQKFWMKKMDERAADKSKRQGQCIVCGRMDQPITRRMPVKLQVGPDRVQLISANEKAFESYGLKASEIAPVCCVCAEVYGRALSYLLSSERHMCRVGSTTHIYWTREPEEFNPWSLVTNPSSDEVEELFQSAFRSKGAAEVDANDFYALSISANTSRMVVRNWIESTVPRVRENIAQYFSRQKMIGPDGDDSFLSLRSLSESLGRRNDQGYVKPKSIPNGAENALVSFALQGNPIPLGVINHVIKRVRADTDNRMTRPRAALMRLVFESQRSHGLIEEDRKVKAELDVDNQQPAYLCGRLLSVLEQIQQKAVKANTTIVDRYFGTASSAPATVFGKLMRTAQNHLGKLRKSDEGAYYALDKQMQEICARISEFPRTLSLQQQALFSLGYYQQKSSDRRSAAENSVSNTN